MAQKIDLIINKIYEKVWSYLEGRMYVVIEMGIKELSMQGLGFRLYHKLLVTTWGI